LPGLRCVGRLRAVPRLRGLRELPLRSSDSRVVAALEFLRRRDSTGLRPLRSGGLPALGSLRPDLPRMWDLTALRGIGTLRGLRDLRPVLLGRLPVLRPIALTRDLRTLQHLAGLDRVATLRRMSGWRRVRTRRLRVVSALRNDLLALRSSALRRDPTQRRRTVYGRAVQLRNRATLPRVSTLRSALHRVPDLRRDRLPNRRGRGLTGVRRPAAGR
jgi:hypothetical protein